MNKSLLCLFALLLCVVTFTPSAQALTNYAVVISNANSSINVGLVDFYNPRSPPPTAVSIQGLQYVGGYYQQSTYNYNTKTLTFIGTIPGSVKSYIYAVDCNQWRVINSQLLEYGDQYRGLESDQTTQPYNIWATFQTDFGGIRVRKLNPTTLEYHTLDSFDGNYYASDLDTKTQNYYVTFNNGTGLYSKIYNVYGNLAYEQKFTFSNIAIQPKGPMNMVYSLYTNTMISSIIITNSDGSTYSSLAFLNWNAATFQVTTMTSYINSIPTANLPDSNFNYVHSVGYIGSQFYIYTYNINTQQLINAVTTPIGILAAY